jgi:uncharacterized protein with WD repeat
VATARKQFFRVRRLPLHASQERMHSRDCPACLSLPGFPRGCQCCPVLKHDSANMVQAQRARLLWNSQGTHILGHTSCDFDATNQSYFGESRLYLLTADGRVDMQVTMENETMVVDAAWSPDGKFFVALGGVAPSAAVLFDTKGKPVYKLGSGPYNQVCWSPQSRFVLLAGFGNMPGDIRLFEKKADNACKPMGGCRSECSVLVEWSPCGRYFMTASVAPRMRVDNRVTVFTYYGTTVSNSPYSELQAASWRPRPVVRATCSRQRCTTACTSHCVHAEYGAPSPCMHVRGRGASHWLPA